MLASSLRGDDPRHYVRLAVILRDQIVSGAVKPGNPVPSITELARVHGHARQTCADAMHLLTGDRLLYLVPGRGYHVTADALDRLEGTARG